MNRVRVMVLVYQPELTHSVWQDAFFEDADGKQLTTENLVDRLEQGVKAGEWVGWRLMRIEREVMGSLR